jgi:lysophospholipase L1-like esterase
MRTHGFLGIALMALLVIPLPAYAELPWEFDEHTRYMALGDSLTAGYGAVPATQGYVYLLYQAGVFDTVPNTLLANAGVPGATSLHVLEHQVPQALEAFQPDVITITVGGNDLLQILNNGDPGQILFDFQVNLSEILLQLRSTLPEASIFISNQYTIPQIPGSELIVPAFNTIIENVAGAYGAQVADVYSAFLDRKGLLLIERNGAGQYQVHPTNAGYRVMARAFIDAAE